MYFRYHAGKDGWRTFAVEDNDLVLVAYFREQRYMWVGDPKADFEKMEQVNPRIGTRRAVQQYLPNRPEFSESTTKQLIHAQLVSDYMKVRADRR